MRNKKKLVLACAVLGGGVAIAGLFGAPDEERPGAAKVEADSEPRFAERHPPQRPVPPDPHARLDGLGFEIPAGAPLDTLPPPPSSPEQFPTEISAPSPSSTSPISRPSSGSDGPIRLAARPVSTAAGSLTHQVVDGDSLRSLAARYLGDAGRASEIYHANRDALSDPELLPIGVSLKIPPPGRTPRLVTDGWRPAR